MTSAAVPITRPRAAPRPVTLVLAALALLLAAQPVLTVAVARIWAPSTMIQEMFSHAFATPMFLEHGMHFVPVGHFFALYTAVPSFVANTLLASWSLFDRAHAFVVSVYLLHGAILAGLYLVALRLTPALHERLALLLVAFGQGWLMRFTNLRLTVNYDLLVNVLCFALACLVVWRVRNQGQPGWKTAIALGALGGVMLGTKYSFLVILGPFMLLVLLPQPLTLGGALRQFAWSGLTLVLTSVLLLIAYLHFQLDHASPFLAELLAYHSSSLVRQSTPFMVQELQRWLDPASYYFGLQALVTIWAILLVATVALVRVERANTLLIVAASAFGAALLAYAFNARRTGGTTLDVSMFLLFDVAVLATCWRGEPRRLMMPRLAIGLLSLAAVLATAMMHPLAVVDRLAANSEQARAFEALRQAHPTLPIVYYMSGYPQPLAFPSIDTYAHVGLQATAVTAAYVRDVLPRTTFRGPADGLLEGPQLMVVPEYLDTFPSSPADQAEWPDMYPRVDTLTSHPAFGKLAARLGSACQIFQFRGEDPTSLHQVWVYPTRVTACVVSENHVQR